MCCIVVGRLWRVVVVGGWVVVGSIAVVGVELVICTRNVWL